MMLQNSTGEGEPILRHVVVKGGGEDHWLKPSSASSAVQDLRSHLAQGAVPCVVNSGPGRSLDRDRGNGGRGLCSIQNGLVLIRRSGLAWQDPLCYSSAGTIDAALDHPPPSRPSRQRRFRLDYARTLSQHR